MTSTVNILEDTVRLEKHSVMSVNLFADINSYYEVNNFIVIVNNEPYFYEPNPFGNICIKLSNVHLTNYDLNMTIKNGSDEVQVYDYELHYIFDNNVINNIKNFHSLSRESQVEFVLSHEDLIKYIKNPPKDLVMAHSLKFKL